MIKYRSNRVNNNYDKKGLLVLRLYKSDYCNDCFRVYRDHIEKALSSLDFSSFEE